MKRSRSGHDYFQPNFDMKPKELDQDFYQDLPLAGESLSISIDFELQKEEEHERPWAGWRLKFFGP